MYRFSIVVLMAYMLMALASCEDNQGQDELSDILSMLPATTNHLIVIRSLSDLASLSEGFGPVVTGEIADFILLPAQLEMLDEYQSRGISIDRPIVLAHLSGDPNDGPERFLIVLPVMDEATAKSALLDHIKSVSDLVDHEDLIVANSPIYESDKGAARFIDGRWLLVGLGESIENVKNLEDVLDEFKASRSVPLGEWIKFSELRQTLSESWGFLLYWRTNNGMRVIGLSGASRGDASSFNYNEGWEKLEPVSNWAQKTSDIGWFTALLDEAYVMENN
jgi:hypothetical protein